MRYRGNMGLLTYVLEILCDEATFMAISSRARVLYA